MSGAKWLPSAQYCSWASVRHGFQSMLIYWERNQCLKRSPRQYFHLFCVFVLSRNKAAFGHTASDEWSISCKYVVEIVRYVTIYMCTATRSRIPTVCVLSTILLSTNLWLWPNLWQHDIEGPNQALQPDFPATALFIEELLILSWDDLRCRIDLFHCRFERATQTVSLLEWCFRSESEFILGKRETWQQPSLTIKLIRMVSTVFLFRSDTQLAWLKYFPGWGWMQHGMRVEKWSIGTNANAVRRLEMKNQEKLPV